MLPTSIATALPSEISPLSGSFFRCVEDQAQIATNALVDNMEEQRVLEGVLDSLKPPIPVECVNLHFLYLTPFRYWPYERDSRFRRKGYTAGVLYAAQSELVSVVEAVRFEIAFFADSPTALRPKKPKQRSTFSIPVATERAVDLSRGIFKRHSAHWTGTSHDACQHLADEARASRVQAIVYEASGTLPAGFGDQSTMNIAVLDCTAIENRTPTFHNWSVRFVRELVEVRELFGKRAFSLPHDLPPQAAKAKS